MDTTPVMFAMCLIMPICGVFAAIVPFLQPRTQAFAVTVPSSADSDAFIKSLKRRYAATVLVATALLSVACVAASVARNFVAFVMLISVGTLALFLASYALMLAYRRRVIAYKKQRGWAAQTQQAVASIGGEPEGAPRGISLKWSLVYVPIVLVTLAIAAAGYPSMPDQIPMHVGFDGTVDRWADKSLGVVLFPIALELFLIAAMVFCHWQALVSKKWQEPGAPASSAWAYGMFVRANTIMLVGCGAIIVAAMGISFELYIVGAIGIDLAIFAMLASCVPLVVASVLVSAAYGQSGSRVFRRMQASDDMLVDDDEHWKLGIFYWNSADASVFVPKRFGIGWTINFARPAAWAAIVGFCLATVAFVLVAAVMVG